MESFLIAVAKKSIETLIEEIIALNADMKRDDEENDEDVLADGCPVAL